MYELRKTGLKLYNYYFTFAGSFFVYIQMLSLSSGWRWLQKRMIAVKFLLNNISVHLILLSMKQLDKRYANTKFLLDSHCMAPFTVMLDI